ncbi:MAG: oligosaccharide repeat unit polymerase, partial [Candidatus Hydrothermarchaeales archaeon]
MIEESRTERSLSTFARFLSSTIEESKTFEILLLAIEFIKNSYYSSRFKDILKKILGLFYFGALWNVFDSVNDRFKESLISEIKIFHPALIVPLVYLAFITVSTYRVSNLGLLSIIAGITFFILGLTFSKRIRFGRVYLDEYSKEMAILFLVLGSFYLALDLLRAGAVPLLNAEARRNLSVFYTYLASLLVPGGILLIALIGTKLRDREMTLKEARMSALAVTIGVTFLITLLGYRTQLVVSLLGCIVAMYFMDIVGIAEIGLSFLGIVFAISFLGYYRAMTQGAALGMWGIIGGRVGLSLSVFDHLLSRFWLFGANRGSTLLATFSSFLPYIPGPRMGPRTIIAQVFGVTNVSMTSTLLGTWVLDFGIPGIMAFMLALGFVIGIAYYAMRKTGSALATAIYSLLIAYTLVGIE